MNRTYIYIFISVIILIIFFGLYKYIYGEEPIVTMMKNFQSYLFIKLDKASGIIKNMPPTPTDIGINVNNIALDVIGKIKSEMPDINKKLGDDLKKGISDKKDIYNEVIKYLKKDIIGPNNSMLMLFKDNTDITTMCLDIKKYIDDLLIKIEKLS